MKRYALLLLVLAVSLPLAGCKSQPVATAQPLTRTSKLSASYDNALSPMAQLAVGTFMLEDTANAVTADQARELAVLWRGYRTLSQSDTVARRELLGVEGQIEDAMTSEQIQAIKDMQLTSEDMMSVITAQGIDLNASTGNDADKSATAQALRQAGNAMGGGPGGGGPGGGGGGMPAGGGGGGMPAGGDGGMMPMGGDAQGSTTGQQQPMAGGMGSTLPTGVLTKLIEVLETE